ncbi:hypothetical protein BHE74_00037504 [Ensete ventricosum]|nr:hypothetical protein BHE74_00037504 [Ensete ventricosum]RZS11574.1 hypothetical protein BHM03_00042915 [Ensete ventricosum]
MRHERGPGTRGAPRNVVMAAMRGSKCCEGDEPGNGKGKLKPFDGTHSWRMRCFNCSSIHRSPSNKLVPSKASKDGLLKEPHVDDGRLPISNTSLGPKEGAEGRRLLTSR